MDKAKKIIKIVAIIIAVAAAVVGIAFAVKNRQEEGCCRRAGELCLLLLLRYLRTRSQLIF